LRVADVAAALKGLKADPAKVLVAAIAGPPDPYVVEVGPAALPDVSMWPVVDHSCTAKEPDGSLTYGDPAVRIAEWVKAFGRHGVFETICTGTFERALEEIAGRERVDLSPCVAGSVLDQSGALWTGATTPDCVVIDHAIDDLGSEVDATLPACVPGQEKGMTACWSLENEPQVCPEGSVVNFNRPWPRPSADVNSTISCSILVRPRGKADASAGCGTP
jgi:hypothetical protein